MPGIDVLRVAEPEVSGTGVLRVAEPEVSGIGVLRVTASAEATRRLAEGAGA